MAMKWHSNGSSSLSLSKLDHNIKMHRDSSDIEHTDMNSKGDISGQEQLDVHVDDDTGPHKNARDRYIAMKWTGEPLNGVSLSDVDNVKIHKPSVEMLNADIKHSVDSVQECNSETDKGSVSGRIVDEDRYQVPDTQTNEPHTTQNHELHSTQNNEIDSQMRQIDCDSRPLSHIPIPVHLREDRPHPHEGLLGEPQLHVHEMSSTVSSPGKKTVNPCFVTRGLTHYHTVPHFDTLKIYNCGKHCE